MAFLHPFVLVTVNGVPRRTLGGSTSCGFRSNFATANIGFDPSEGAVDPGSTVAVILGYQETGRQLVFLGEVDDDTLDYWPQARGVSCSGYLARTSRGSGVEQADADPDEETGVRPAYQASDVTDDAAVTALLGLYGVPIGDIQGDTPVLTLGTLAPVLLGKDQAAWDLIAEIDRLTFMRTFDGPDGLVRRTPTNTIPSFASFTLTEGVNIMGGSRARSRRGIVNRVTMTGIDSPVLDFVPRAERKADSIYIPDPPRYVSEEWQSNLAETEEVCDLYAARRVAQLNRLTDTVPVSVDRCRPDIRPGMSLAISATHFEYGPTTLFWVEQVEHSWDEKSANTNLSLLAASATAGINPNLRPIAVINLRFEIEVLADGSTLYVVQADGRDSHDPDGDIEGDPQHGIAAYLWSGVPVGPSGDSATAPQATFVYTTSPVGATITLVVYDVDGKTGTATRTITVTDVASAVRRDLWAAVSSDLLYNPGTGVWGAVGVAAVGLSEIAHPEYQLAYTAAGDLWKVTVAADGSTFSATAVYTGHSITAVSINLGPLGTGTGRAWAGAADGKVYLSINDGASWTLAGTVTPPTGSTGGSTIHHVEESPFASGALLAACGAGVFRSFDRGATWVLAKDYPDHALTAWRVATGRFADATGDHSYQFAAWQGTSSNVTSRVLELSDQETVDWASGDKPPQPTGLTMGVYAPELYVVENKGGGKSWVMPNFITGGNFAAGAYDLSYGVPRHIVRDGYVDGIIYGAADSAIFKTVDKFTTTHELLDLASPRVGKMVGFGALRNVSRPPGELIVSAFGGGLVQIIRRNTDGTWEKLADHPVSPAAAAAMRDSTSGVEIRPLLRCQSRLFTWVSFWGETSGLLYGSVNTYYSDDWGVTWNAMSLQGVNWLAVDANGTTMYAAHNATADPPVGGGSLNNRVDAISRSTDNGATWTKMSDLPASFINSSGGCTITCSQDTSGTVVLFTGDGYRISTNGGATFGATFGPGSSTHFAFSGSFARSPSDNAMLGFVFNSGDSLLFYTPDGVTVGTELAHSPVGESYVADIRTIGGIMWVADGKLRYSTNGGSSISPPAAPPASGGYTPAIHAVCENTADPSLVFVGGQGEGTITSGISYPAYWSYNVDSGEFSDITASHFADLGGMFWPYLYGMIVRPGV